MAKVNTRWLHSFIAMSEWTVQTDSYLCGCSRCVRACTFRRSNKNGKWSRTEPSYWVDLCYAIIYIAYRIIERINIRSKRSSLNERKLEGAFVSIQLFSSFCIHCWMPTGRESSNEDVSRVEERQFYDFIYIYERWRSRMLYTVTILFGQRVLCFYWHCQVLNYNITFRYQRPVVYINNCAARFATTSPSTCNSIVHSYACVFVWMCVCVCLNGYSCSLYIVKIRVHVGIYLLFWILLYLSEIDVFPPAILFFSLALKNELISHHVCAVFTMFWVIIFACKKTEWLLDRVVPQLASGDWQVK